MVDLAAKRPFSCRWKQIRFDERSTSQSATNFSKLPKSSICAFFKTKLVNALGSMGCSEFKYQRKDVLECDTGLESDMRREVQRQKLQANQMVEKWHKSMDRTFPNFTEVFSKVSFTMMMSCW